MWEFTAQELTSCIAWKLIDEMNGAREFVVGQMFRSVDEQTISINSAPDTGPNKANGNLSPLRIGKPTDTSLFYIRVRQKHILNFGRIDILTTGDNQICTAI